MTQREVFIVGAARTPIGAFSGALAEVPSTQLGATALRAALERASVKPELVDHTFMGCVLPAGLGQAPARQASKAAGMPNETGAVTINKVCGSGLYAGILGTQNILLGDADIIAAGGMESMSRAPYLLPKARQGYRMGNGEIVDGMIVDGLWDPYNDFHMGRAGELCAREYAFDREAQDEFATESYRRAIGAQKEGAFEREIAPVTIQSRKGDVTVAEDEEPQRAKLDKMGQLKPAFEKEGTITAANASKVNDGGAAIVLASGEAVKKHGLKPVARVLGYGGHAQAPEWFTTAPVGAIKKTLTRLELEPKDIDLWEVNEAFSAVAMAVAKDVGIDHQRLNVRGGAVALGHPIGASGARILVTLLHAMADQQARRGVASLCLGGGEAVALAVERV